MDNSKSISPKDSQFMQGSSSPPRLGIKYSNKVLPKPKMQKPIIPVLGYQKKGSQTKCVQSFKTIAPSSQANPYSRYRKTIADSKTKKKAEEISFEYIYPRETSPTNIQTQDTCNFKLSTECETIYETILYETTQNQRTSEIQISCK